MAAPTPYVPAYNFTNFQTVNPSTPLPANALDAELFDIKITTDQLIANLGQIQRSDNALANGIVTPDSLNTAVLNLMGGYTPRGAWLTGTSYAAKDVVTQSSATYLCRTPHVSGTFATDLAAGDWLLIAGSAGTVALSTLSDVTLTTPASGHLLSYNGSAWVNGFLTLANTPNGLLTFAKLNAAAFSTDGAFASANNTTLPTTLAVKTYCTTQAFRATGANIAAASTLSLTGAFDYVQVTGNTTINAITLNANEEKWVRFTGTPQITHNGTSLILPGAANIVAAVNDRMLVRGLDGTNVICLQFVRANGQAIVAAATGVVTVKQQVFTSSGTYTPSTGMLYCIVEGVDGGAGGGGVKVASSSNVAVAAGGAAGAYGRSVLTAAQVGVSQTVTIGAGGAAGANTGGTGGSGGATSLGSLFAGGTALGGQGSTNAATTQAATGQAGSIFTTADFTPRGPNGNGGFAFASPTLGVSGSGMCSLWGNGGDSARAVASGAVAGVDAQGVGGAGGGAVSITTTTGAVGGVGFKGALVITEFCSQ